MAERVPILIGITGKRDLKGQDDVVRERLRAAFDTLDRETPHAPKVLLSGMAIGADTIAVELALARADWLVAAVLPFDAQTYFEDFQGASLAALGATLADTRVKTCPLPPLRNPYTGRPCTREELRNGANTVNPLRVLHYEQLGLWLAQAATLLIAVLPKDEQPDQAGGTSRVLRYRLSGRPDVVARQVMDASVAVCEPLPLDIGSLGPAWLIDAPSQTSSPTPFSIRLQEGDTGEPCEAAESEVWQRRSLAVLRGLDGLAARSGGPHASPKWRVDRADAVATIGEIYAEIDHIQGRHKRRLVWSSYALALLFWLAVGTFGLIEVVRGQSVGLDPRGIAIYLALVGCAVLLHGAVDNRRWQRVTEDYRGVVEALRLQRAWWHAGLVGLPDQVDRYYLAGSQRPFLYVRHAVRNIAFWARLCGLPEPIEPDFREVYARDNPLSWIREQIDYFGRRAHQRKCAVSRVQMVSWEAFFTAQLVALWLFVDTVTHERLLKLIESLTWRPRSSVLAALLLASAAATWALRHVRSRPAPPRRRWLALYAIVLAFLIGPGLYFLGDLLWPDAGHLAIAVGVVLFSAAAAATRFIAEKLVWEAEAHRYEAALALFERAATELDIIDVNVDTAAERAAQRQIVIRALGRAALEENEYWLRAHRERPVEQAVG